MKTYNITYNNKRIQYNDCYIHIEKIPNVRRLNCLFKLNLVCSCVDDIATFINKYKKFEKEFNNKRASANYGTVITFLLDKERDSNECKKIVYELLKIKEYKNLPYAAFVEVQGEGTFLHVWLCDRMYDPINKFEWGQIAGSNRYKNKLTNQFCKKEDENAFLAIKKGELINTKKLDFSKKQNICGFGSGEKGKRSFYAWKCKTEQWWMDILKKLFSLEINEGLVIHKVCYKGKSKKQRIKARAFNKKLNIFANELDPYLSFIKQNCSNNHDIDEVIYKIINLRDAAEGKKINVPLHLLLCDKETKLYTDYFDNTCCSYRSRNSLSTFAVNTFISFKSFIKKHIRNISTFDVVQNLTELENSIIEKMKHIDSFIQPPLTKTEYMFVWKYEHGLISSDGEFL